MKITDFSFPCTVMFAAYGYELKLVSVLDDEGILFTADLRKADINPDFNDLSDADKQTLEKTIGDIKNPDQASQKVSPSEVSKIKQALNRVNVENLAFFWDKQNKTGLTYIELKLDLSNTVSLFDGNFEIDYLLLDLIISTGGKVINDIDKERKEKIKQLRTKIWEDSEEENQLNELIKKIHKNDVSQLNELIKKSRENDFQLQNEIQNFQNKSNQYSKTIQGLRQSFFRQDSLRENIEKKFSDDIDNFNKEKSHEIFSYEKNLQHLKENHLISTQNEQNARYAYVEQAFAQFKPQDSSFMQKEKDLEIINERFRESQILEKKSFQISHIPLQQETTFEEEIIKLKEDKLNDFEKLELIKNFDDL